MIPAILLNYIMVVTALLSASCIITLSSSNFGSIIGELTTYGKVNQHTHRRLTKWIAVPKRWFRHFYIVAMLSVSACLYLGYEFTTGARKSAHFFPYLRMLTSKSPQTSFNVGMVVLGMQLLHVTRRMIETQFISVYSSTEMNIFHYVMGIVHYIILPLSVVCETLGFASTSVYKLALPDLTTKQMFGVILFVFANYEQFKVAKTLAAVRKNGGQVDASGHAICHGGLFDQISCPHFLLEILIYFGLFLVLPSGVVAYKYMMYFVVVNQFFAAQITHRWYKSNFKDYPPQRKAIIPYLF